jgi:hypothetical protein
MWDTAALNIVCLLRSKVRGLLSPIGTSLASDCLRSATLWPPDDSHLPVLLPSAEESIVPIGLES